MHSTQHIPHENVASSAEIPLTSVLSPRLTCIVWKEKLAESAEINHPDYHVLYYSGSGDQRSPPPAGLQTAHLVVTMATGAGL